VSASSPPAGLAVLLTLPCLDIASIADPKARYWAYYDSSSIASGQSALEQLASYTDAEGPFDAVIGFSQGASLAAMHLLRHAQESPDAPPPFRCGIFLSSIAVCDPAALMRHGTVRMLNGKLPPQTPPIQVPTAHIWGVNDPSREDSQQLRQLCAPTASHAFIHGDGHIIPGLAAKDDLTSMVKIIRRALAEVE
jgi:pimeloyl-ACP methyl ester carboxylesterase